jgi:hypothetical protein
MAIAQFDTFDNSFVVRFNINQLVPRAQEEVLWKLLATFDPGTQGERYEEYQRAAEVILAVAKAQADKLSYE